MRRPGRRRMSRGSRNFSISATNAEWREAGVKAARRGLSRSRYAMKLVEEDVSGGDRPFTALAAEEQRELMEAVREIRALPREGPAPDDREPAHETPARPKPRKARPAKSSDPPKPTGPEPDQGSLF